MVMCVLVEVGVLFDRAGIGEHEDMLARPHDLDAGAVKPGEHGLVDDLVDGAERRLAAAEIEDAVDGAEKLVELVGAEENGDLHLTAEPGGELDDHVLMTRIEADERLVEKQDSRLAEER